MKQVYMGLFALLFVSTQSLDAMESKEKSAVSAPKGWSYYAKIIGVGVGGGALAHVAGWFICADDEHYGMCMEFMDALGMSVGGLAGSEYAKRSLLKIKKEVAEKQS